MRNIFLLTGILCMLSIVSAAQAPEKFNYQAVLRNSSGDLIANQSVDIEISIIDDNSGGPVLYTETHTKTTNSYGLVNLIIGSEIPDFGVFSDINWAVNDKFIQVKVDATDMGTFQLLSVPFAMHAGSATNLGSENVYTGTDTLFVVKDAEGNPVFVVFPDGAKVIVEEATKGTVGGFAVSGRSPTKSEETEIFHVTPDSTRIFVNDTVQSKGTVGGFAVSGRSPTKSIKSNYLLVTQDSTRVYINDTISAKGRVGGFAVSGRSPTKGIGNNYFVSTPDSTRIYVNDSTLSKGRVGGFAVSGRSPTKAGANTFMDMTKENYFIGHGSGQKNVDGLYNTFFGYEAGLSNIGDAGGDAGRYNVFMGYKSGYLNTNGYSNIFIGYEAGYTNTNTPGNIFIGSQSGRNATGGVNIGIGGYTGMYSTGSGNIFIGNQAGRFTNSGYQNTLVGTSSGYYNQTGIRNVFVGYETGRDNVSGSNNVFIGHQAGFYEKSSSKLYIESSSSSSPLIYGDFANDILCFNGNVGIGTTSPTQKLEVVGDIRLSGADRSIEISDGYLNIKPHDSTYGLLLRDYTGNSSIWSNFRTIDATTDYLHIAMNSTTTTEGLVISDNGNIGIGTTSPAQKLDVAGDIELDGAIYGAFGTIAQSTDEWLRLNPSNSHSFGTYVSGNLRADGGIYVNDDEYFYFGGEDVIRTDDHLYVNGEIRQGGTDYGAYEIQTPGQIYTNDYLVAMGGIHVGGTSDPGTDDLYVDGTVRINGNVGIGVAPTAEKLWVDNGTTYGAYTTSGWQHSSDRRLKTNIEPIKSSLDKILQLQGVYFNWKKDPIKKQVGLIAQDVEPILPEVVSKNDEGFYSIAYGAFTPVLIEAIKEQQSQIEELKKENQELKQKLNEIIELLNKE